MIDTAEIKYKLSLLEKSDPNHQRFGASHHHYKLNDPLSSAFVQEFETKNKIVLPRDYSEFLVNIGDGGVGPYYGLLSLMDSVVDFKLDNKPAILVNQEFPYSEAWNEDWIEKIDWETERPEHDVVNKYLDVSHICGSLQICHFGHGCTYLLIVNGKERGNIWFDGRADYGGLYPETTDNNERVTFLKWYMDWLDSSLSNLV